MVDRRGECTLQTEFGNKIFPCVCALKNYTRFNWTNTQVILKIVLKPVTNPQVQWIVDNFHESEFAVFE